MIEFSNVYHHNLSVYAWFEQSFGDYFVEDVQKFIVAFLVDQLIVELLDFSEVVVASAAFHSFDTYFFALFSVDSELEVGLLDFILHFARNDSKFAFLKLVPKVDLPPPLKVEPSDCKSIRIKFLQLPFVVFEVKTHDQGGVAQFSIGILLSSIQSSIFLYDIHQNIGVILLNVKDVLSIIFDKFNLIFFCRIFHFANTTWHLIIPSLRYHSSFVFLQEGVNSETCEEIGV